MNAHNIYTHLYYQNIFSIKDKIKKLQKSNKNDNKNRKNKN
jgi:hypothetical protein|tara:strand:- start:4163 stop:4285 length:123 start_codon:yes stop_codon:yes gene_type:complete